MVVVVRRNCCCDGWLIRVWTSKGERREWKAEFSEYIKLVLAWVPFIERAALS